MAHTFGRLIASGPLPFRGPRSIVPPVIISAVEGVPVVYDVGEWAGFGPVTIVAQVFSDGVALPDEGGVVIPNLEHGAVYLVVTATDDSGVTVQVTSEPVSVIPLARFPVVIDAPMILSAVAGKVATATLGSATVGQVETARWLIGDNVIAVGTSPMMPGTSAGSVLTLEVVWENLGARTVAISAPVIIGLPPYTGPLAMLLESGEFLLLESGGTIHLEREA